MQTNTQVHLTDKARVHARVETGSDGKRYLVLSITDDGQAYPSLTIFPEGPEFLDKLANECERAVREFVGDVPVAPSQEYLDGLGEVQAREVVR